MKSTVRDGIRDIVVVGGSAGALQALVTMLGALPAGYRGTILIVLHSGSKSPGLMDAILSRVTPLPCGYAEDGQALQGGRIYLAPPDRHLLVEDNRLRVVFGPKQNWHRPAINPLFLSAAKLHGRRACGVILSGMLDDGTIGLMAIRDAGGATIVQSPDDALFPAMPQNALRYVEADYTVPVARIPEILVALSREPVRASPGSAPMAHGGESTEEKVVASGLHSRQEPAALTCPECGGALSEKSTAGALNYYCFLGHGFTSQALWNNGFERAEQTLWLALRTMEESAAMGRRLMAQAAEEGHREQVLELGCDIERLERDADRVRAILYDRGA